VKGEKIKMIHISRHPELVSGSVQCTKSVRCLPVWTSFTKTSFWEEQSNEFGMTKGASLT